jgi:hypothetical protein
MIGNGNLLGKGNTPSASVATGVWSMSEQLYAKLNTTWPVSFEASYLGSSDAEFLGSSGTFSSVNFGNAATFRHIIVTITSDRGADNRVPTSVTIGGVSATLHIVQRDVSSVRENASAVASAIVPSGTSGNIEITFSGIVSGCAISVFSVIRGNSNITPVQTVGFPSTPFSTSTLSAYSYAVAVVNNQTAPSSVEWTNITEYSDFSVTGNRHHHSSAFTSVYASTFSATLSDTSGEETFAAVTWII